MLSLIAKFLNRPMSKFVRDGLFSTLRGGAERQTLRRDEGRGVVQQRAYYARLIVGRCRHVVRIANRD